MTEDNETASFYDDLPGFVQMRSSGGAAVAVFAASKPSIDVDFHVVPAGGVGTQHLMPTIITSHIVPIIEAVGSTPSSSVTTETAVSSSRLDDWAAQHLGHVSLSFEPLSTSTTDDALGMDGDTFLDDPYTIDEMSSPPPLEEADFSSDDEDLTDKNMTNNTQMLLPRRFPNRVFVAHFGRMFTLPKTAAPAPPKLPDKVEEAVPELEEVTTTESANAKKSDDADKSQPTEEQQPVVGTCVADKCLKPTRAILDNDDRVEVRCSLKRQCVVHYHLKCWKALDKFLGISTASDKNHVRCVTPDCDGFIQTVKRVTRRSGEMKEHVSEFRRSNYVEPVVVPPPGTTNPSGGSSSPTTTTSVPRPRKPSGTTVSPALPTGSKTTTVMEIVEPVFKKEPKKRPTEKTQSEVAVSEKGNSITDHPTKVAAENKSLLSSQQQPKVSTGTTSSVAAKQIDPVKSTIRPSSTVATPSSVTKGATSTSSSSATVTNTTNTSTSAASAPGSPMVKQTPRSAPPLVENMWNKKESVQLLKASLSGSPIPSQRTQASARKSDTEEGGLNKDSAAKLALDSIPEFVPTSQSMLPMLTPPPSQPISPAQSSSASVGTKPATGHDQGTKFVVPAQGFVPRFSSAPPVAEEPKTAVSTTTVITQQNEAPESVQTADALFSSTNLSSTLEMNGSNEPLLRPSSNSLLGNNDTHLGDNLWRGKNSRTQLEQNEDNDSDDDRAPAGFNVILDQMVDTLLRDDRPSITEPALSLASIPSFVPRQQSPPFGAPTQTASFVPRSHSPPIPFMPRPHSPTMPPFAPTPMSGFFIPRDHSPTQMMSPYGAGPPGVPPYATQQFSPPDYPPSGSSPRMYGSSPPPTASPPYYPSSYPYHHYF